MAWIPIKDLGQGVNKDLLPEELAPGVASSSQNVRFRNGSAESFGGMTSVYTTPPVTPYHICHYTVGTTKYVVYAGTQRTFVDDGTTQTEITLANNTGTLDDRWSGFVFNGTYIQNNGVDVPQYWGGNTASDLANLTAWPAGYKAGFMRAFGPYIIAGDITRSGTREPDTVLWSSSTDPGAIPSSWNIADATKDAGDQPIAETNGNLVDGRPMGNIFVLYKDDALHYMQPIQNNFIFQFGRLPGNTGVLARGCVEEFPGGHVYLTPGFDVVVQSGQGPSSILEGRWRKWLASNMSSTVPSRSFVVNSTASKEILVCFPSGSATSCDKALVWNYQDDKLYTRDLPNVTYGSNGQVSITPANSTWSAATQTWATKTGHWANNAYASDSPRTILTTTTPSLVMFDDGTQDVGSNFTASVEYTGMHFDEPGTVKLIRGIRPKFYATNGAVIKCQVGASMRPDTYPTWKDAVDFTQGTSVVVNSITAGRHLAVRFYTTDGTAFRIRSCDLDIVPQGDW